MIEKHQTQRLRVVVGRGYVGLPLAVRAAEVTLRWLADRRGWTF